MVHSDLTRQKLARAAFWVLALTLLLLPIGLGGARPLPLALAQAGLAAFFFLVAVSCPPLLLAASLWPKRLQVAALLLLLVMLWGLIQILPFTPIGWHHPLWLDTSAALNLPYHGSISLAPEAGWTVLTDWLTYLTMGIATYLVAREPGNAEKLVTMFWCVAVALCLYGLVLLALGQATILWFHKWSYQNDVTATFVNRNHFAGYAGIAFVTGFALMWQSLRNALRNLRAHQRAEALQSWLLRRGLPYILGLTIVGTAVVLSHSRAGLLIMLAGLAAFAVFYLLYQRRFGWIFATLGITVAGMLALVLTLQDSGRFATLFTDWSSKTRGRAYEMASEAILANPWLGHGMGSFETAFRLYRDERIGVFMNHAHNDWLESAFDLGIPAAALLFIAIALCLSGCWHGIRTRRQHGFYPALGLAASLMLLAHALVDFNLQIPGLVASWMLLLGTGLAQSWSRRAD